MDKSDGQPDLDDLVASCLAAIEDSGLGAVEALCRRHPAQAADLRRRIELLMDSGLLEAPDAGPRLPERLGPYRVRGRLGDGGMGVVYLAEDADLGREVAIKTIRPELLYSARTRARFEREVATVAKLAHAGIVPVYGAGVSDDVPWFAMERLRGATLAELLASLQDRAPSSLSGADLRAALATVTGETPDADVAVFGGDWTEVVAVLGRELAAAVDHAHRAGVLHRDLKPSNVLLGLDGRPRLFDFGLALPDEDSDLTRTGAQVGSLPYMAPEQLRGEAVDRRTDVYGLGATLWELATLRPPFAGGSREALRAAILSAPPVALRSGNPALPRVLAVVLGQALERRADDRYATAAELARDLDHVLALEPVDARPAGPLRRVADWARRRPAVATLVATLALAAIAVPVGLGIANARISAALDEARVERQRADANFDRAFDALVGLVTDVADEDLDLVPGFAPRRAAILAETLDSFEALVSELGGAPGVEVARGRIQRERARVFDLLGRQAEAEAALEGSLAALRRAVELRPGSLAATTQLAESLVFGSVRAQGDDAEREFELEAVALLEPLLSGSQDGGALPHSGGRSERDRALGVLRQARHNLAETAMRAGELQLAAEQASDALDEARRFAREAGGTAPRYALGESLGLAATLAAREGRDGEADGLYAEATDVLTALVAEDPSPAFRHRLGLTLANGARLALRSEELSRAQALADRAVAVREPLAAEHPYATRYLVGLADAYEVAALVLTESGRRDEGLVLLEANAATLDRLSELQPDDGTVARQRLIAHHNLAVALLVDARWEEARVHSAIGAPGLEAVAARDPRYARSALHARLTDHRARAWGGAVLDPAELTSLVLERAPDDPLAWYALAGALAASLGASDAEGATREALATGAVAAVARVIDSGAAERADFDRPEYAGLAGRRDFDRELARLVD